MPELRLSFVTLDCVDLDRVAAFWAALLEEFRWRTVQDPEGNEFDITTVG